MIGNVRTNTLNVWNYFTTTTPNVVSGVVYTVRHARVMRPCGSIKSCCFDHHVQLFLSWESNNGVGLGPIYFSISRYNVTKLKHILHAVILLQPMSSPFGPNLACGRSPWHVMFSEIQGLAVSWGTTPCLSRSCSAINGSDQFGNEQYRSVWVRTNLGRWSWSMDDSDGYNITYCSLRNNHHLQFYFSSYAHTDTL